MEKGLCWGALGVAAVLLLVFLLDLIVKAPFSGNVPPDKSSPFMLIDIVGVLASGLIGYLSWNALRDLR
jgi:hypothetical protein